MVGGFSRGLQFAVCLIEQFLGLLRVTIHVPLVGVLCILDAAVGLVAESLRRGEIGMMVGVDVALRRSLCEGDARGCETQAQNAAHYPLMCKFHIHDLRKKNYRRTRIARN